MSRPRLAILLLSLGLVASPLASLYCDTRDAADMACCKGDMSECNQPGKTQDCCKVAPTGREGAAVVLKAPDQRVALAAVALPVPSVVPLPPPAVSLRVRPSVPRRGDPSPPRTPILRV